MPGVGCVLRVSGALAMALAATLGAAALHRADAAPGAAPRFKVQDTRGQTLDSHLLLRKGPVLLDFWATWCKPCHAALPELESWHRTYGPRGLTVIGVSIDGPRNYSKVRPFVARMGITYPIVIDEDGRLQHLYQVLAVPTAFLIDSTGTIVRVRTGYRPGEGVEFEKLIRTLLPGGAEGQSPSDSAGGSAKP